MDATPLFVTSSGLEAVPAGGEIEIRERGRTVARVAFYRNGIFTVRQPGRGYASRLPPELAAADLARRVDHALQAFAVRH
jgi:antitoxin (DNA-binding transcriptional repressor) of toxin-antitoxin stability system